MKVPKVHEFFFTFVYKIIFLNFSCNCMFQMLNKSYIRCIRCNTFFEDDHVVLYKDTVTHIHHFDGLNFV